MAMATTLVMWPGPWFEQILASPSNGGSTWYLASIGPWGLKEMFEIDKIWMTLDKGQ